jgi:hypothetical protein
MLWDCIEFPTSVTPEEVKYSKTVWFHVLGCHEQFAVACFRILSEENYWTLLDDLSQRLKLLIIRRPRSFQKLPCMWNKSLWIRYKSFFAHLYRCSLLQFPWICSFHFQADDYVTEINSFALRPSCEDYNKHCQCRDLKFFLSWLYADWRLKSSEMSLHIVW